LRKSGKKKSVSISSTGSYAGLVGGISELLEMARRSSARAVNAFMTATYWEIGRRIVEFEQGGKKRAEYGKALLERLSNDLTERYGRGFARPNLIRFRQFYSAFPVTAIRSTLSNESLDASYINRSTALNELELHNLARAFPLPWSSYVLLISRARSPEAFIFYHGEALRGGWSVRQLQRQIDTQFYERAALSRNKAAMLIKGSKPAPGDITSADEEIRHPLVLEFLNLRDEYSESDLEDSLIRHLETFLLELGNDFAFVGRQRRLRIDDEWYRVDLLFFHRRLRCLVIFDLKLGRFTHADAGQMHMYLNYAREHWAQAGENPPVGVVLCSGKNEALVHYATAALPTKLLVREYLTALPDESVLAAELENTRKQIEARK
jgi:predicted nuclease of restriction endonuclease-like (RecB) superfamily